MEYWDNLLQNGKSIQNLIRKTWDIESNNQGQVLALTNALLLNEGIPRAYRGKKLRLKNSLLLPLISEEINYC